MTEEKSGRASSVSAVSPMRREILLGALALIISAYAVYGLSRNDLSLSYWYGGKAYDKLHFTGASAWI